MKNLVSDSPRAISQLTTPVNQRAHVLAARLEEGARALAAFASTLTPEEWQRPVLGDGRKVGVVVHHVASVYPLEIQLAQTLAGGRPVTGVTTQDVHAMNAGHAKEYDGISKEAALDLLLDNSAAAGAAVRVFTADDLDRAAEASLYSNAPVTCQFMLEDHAVRHSYHHLASIRRTLKR
jgi:hypothetical protein